MQGNIFFWKKYISQIVIIVELKFVVFKVYEKKNNVKIRLWKMFEKKFIKICVHIMGFNYIIFEVSEYKNEIHKWQTGKYF